MAKPGLAVMFFCLILSLTGCFAPLHSPGIPACTLPEHYRTPQKSMQSELNYSQLTRAVPDAYLLGPDDRIQVMISQLGQQPNQQGPNVYTTELKLNNQGEIILPLVGNLNLNNLTLDQTRRAIAAAYADGFLKDPQVSVTLTERSSTSVMVLGEVNQPGVYQLPKYENDIAHALTLAGGLSETSGEKLVVERRNVVQKKTVVPKVTSASAIQLIGGHTQLQTIPVKTIPESLEIPLRGDLEFSLSPQQAELKEGDVIRVAKQKDEVFFVVGKLSTVNAIRFSLGKDNRDLGGGFILPPDRDVDVVTAVAMAGYIDPIDSPTTVTVQRNRPNCAPLLIHVDLIEARTCRAENVMVQAGDIIYLNPDHAWWFRRTFDRILPDLITFPYERSILKAFGQQRN